MSKYIFISIISFSAMSAIAGQAGSYKSYCNTKFDFCIEYPADFKDEGESDSGDGDVFESGADLKTQIRVFGSYNIDDESPKHFAKHMQKELIASGGSVTYQVQKKKFVVLSGFKDNGKTIYYSKTLFDGDRLLNLIITYPKSVEKKVAPIVDKVSGSLAAAKHSK